jgi:hypothetical protein
VFFDIISRKAEDEKELDIAEDGRSRKKGNTGKRRDGI